MTVRGNLAFQSGALYLVQVIRRPRRATRLLWAAARASPAPCRRCSRRAGMRSRTYTILSAAGGLGGTTFNNVTTTNLPAGFAASLSYTASDVILNLTAQLHTIQAGGLSENQTQRRHRARQLLQRRRHAAARFRQRVRAHRQQSRQCAEPALRRGRDRRPAGRLPNGQPVSWADARSVRRWAQRRRRRRRARDRLRARARSGS